MTAILDWIVLAGGGLLYGAVFAWMIRSNRRWSRKARTKRRLLVKDQDGQPMWCSVRGRVLVGWLNSKGEITSGAVASVRQEF
jgi:hypothetical protein